MKVAIIKYTGGNILSLEHAVRRLGVTPSITSDPEEISRADKVLFPGQGEASTAMEFLRSRGLDRTILGLARPFLGICLGMQIMCKRSEEGACECLGVLPLEVRRFSIARKVPHVGWNTLETPTGSIMKGVPAGSHVYFVHSYYVPPSDSSCAETCHEDERFCSAVEYRNFYGVQFHPEKSGPVGMEILRNFLFEVPA